MKILVTGATGFVGKYVIAELLKYDHEIVLAVANKSAAIDTLPNGLARVQLDLNRLDADKDYFAETRQPDLLIHLAWQGLPNYNQNFHLEKNLPGHKLFLQNMIGNGLKQLCVTGTCLEYGMKEGRLTEDMECKPVIPYAQAKNELRIYLESLQGLHHFNLTWIRLFYMFGTGQNPNSLLSQLEAALGRGDKDFNMSEGEQLRDYLPVNTVAENIVKIALQDKITGIVNCCSGEPVTVKSLVQDYIEKNDKKINLKLGYYPYTDYEPMAFWGDTTKLNTILND